MLHLAARHALVLARVRAFSSSQQPRVLLRAFKGFGMAGGVFMHDVNGALFHELDRLVALEQHQQHEQGQQFAAH
jgi:hypothetical protein